MLEFRPIQLEDAAVYRRLTGSTAYPLCEYCFTDLLIWHAHYHVEVCFAENMFFARAAHQGRYSYIVPAGTGNFPWAIEQIRQDAARAGETLRLYAVCREAKERLEKEFPGKFAFVLNRDGCDYIYEAEKLITLKGKKLQPKRNLVNRFIREYEGRWTYQEMTAADREAVYRFHLAWCEANRVCQRGNEYQGETCAVYQALENWEALALQGGMLLLDGRMIAFTIGSHYRPDMYVMHFEKAKGDIAGAYQMINQQFAQRHFQTVSYVNREEDMGLAGLRKAKMSYGPLNMGEEYSGVWKG